MLGTGEHRAGLGFQGEGSPLTTLPTYPLQHKERKSELATSQASPCRRPFPQLRSRLELGNGLDGLKHARRAIANKCQRSGYLGAHASAMTYRKAGLKFVAHIASDRPGVPD